MRQREIEFLTKQLKQAVLIGNENLAENLINRLDIATREIAKQNAPKQSNESKFWAFVFKTKALRKRIELERCKHPSRKLTAKQLSEIEQNKVILKLTA